MTKCKAHTKIVKKREPQDELQLHSLFRFFANPANVRQMIRVLSPDSKVTRSILDWFVTSYVKSTDVEYVHDGRTINVYSEYRIQLKQYGKKRSDPFCRGNESSIPLTTGIPECPVIHTSSRQLCFMRWAISINLLVYIETHYDRLREAYNVRKHKPLKNQVGTTKKKDDPSIVDREPTLCINIYPVPIRVRNYSY